MTSTEQFYFLFNSHSEAENSLPSFDSDKAIALRKKADYWRQREEESFQNCDTDGCVSQWCMSISARDCDQEAELANQGNLGVFRALVDTQTGDLVATTIHTFVSRFHYGNEHKWAVRRNGKTEWITDYKRESGFAAKNLRVVWMLAPVKLYSRHPANHTPEPKGMSGLASYHGKSVGIDYDAIGLRP
jgi:hypothetical protein